jgi:hypothetical protein
MGALQQDPMGYVWRNADYVTSVRRRDLAFTFCLHGGDSKHVSTGREQAQLNPLDLLK